LNSVFRVHTLLAENTEPDEILRELAESCTSREAPEGVGAIFALIGERKTGLPVAAPSGARAEERLGICALSGDSAWAHSVEHGPLEMFWRRAVETGELTGAEAGALPLARNISRIVAIPLAYEGSAHGVLLAGLPRSRTSLESLERLEQRALLATQVLQQKSPLVGAGPDGDVAHRAAGVQWATCGARGPRRFRERNEPGRAKYSLPGWGRACRARWQARFAFR